MIREMFWLHSSQFNESQVGHGFSVFSLPHIIWLLISLLMVVAYTVLYKKGSEERRDNMRKACAFFLLALEIFKQCEMALTNAPIWYYLPLELCSIAEFVILLDALWPKNWFLKQMLSLAFLPAAILALLFPTVTPYPPISFYAGHQFVFHAVIVAYIVALYAAGEVKPTFKGLWGTVVALAIMLILVYPINKNFNTNYIFLMHHEDNPILKMLWSVSGNTGGAPYIAALVAFSALVMHIVFGIYALIGRLGKK